MLNIIFSSTNHLDFKDLLKSNNRNIFFLNVIDESSRYFFVSFFKYVSTQIVIKYLCQLFSIFGMLVYVHSDRSTFMSAELHWFLLNKGIATSRMSAYNSAFNVKVEKHNSTVWKAIAMALKMTMSWRVSQSSLEVTSCTFFL